MVSEWLKNGCPYLPGVAILRANMQYSPYAISMFEGFEDADYIPERLEEKLRYCLSQIPEKELVNPPSPVTTDTIVINTVEVKELEPEAILMLRYKARKLHKRQAYLHAQLSLLETDEDRYNAAHEIMDVVIPALDKIYDQIRSWKETGDLPRSSSDYDRGFQEGVEALNRINSLGSRISKLKGLLKKNITDKEKLRYEKELLDKQLELINLKKKTNG